MRILIPLDEKNRFEALITPLERIVTWALVELNEGQIVDVSFHKNKSDIKEWIDYVILENDEEYFEQFFKLNISVLIANHEKSVDEIIESFLLDRLIRVEE